MKRLFLLFLLLFNPVFANSDLQDVGIAKYAVLKVLNDKKKKTTIIFTK